MLKTIIGDGSRTVNVNTLVCIAAAIYMGITGAAVFIVQPGFVQGLVQYKGFSEQQAGYVAAAEMWGIALVTVGLTFFTRRINWRKALAVSAGIAFLGNVVSIWSDDFLTFSVLRAAVGLGSGILISLSFTAIGLTANPDRNFGWLVMWVLVYGAIGFLLMPYLYEYTGFAGALWFFVVLNGLAIFFVRFMPVSGHGHAVIDEDARELPINYKALGVATLFIYFMAQGVVWAYLFLIGTAAGVSEQQVSEGLTLSQFLGIAGAMVAAMVGNRFGRIRSITLGVSISIVSLGVLLGGVSATTYVVSVCVFNFAWNMTHPFLLAALAMFDRTGSVVAYGIAGQMLGLAVGPAVAASMLVEGSYNNIIVLGAVLFALSIATITPPLRKYLSAQ